MDFALSPRLFDKGLAGGVEADAGKYLASEAGRGPRISLNILTEKVLEPPQSYCAGEGPKA